MIYFANMCKELSTTINYIQLQYNEHLAQLKLTEDLIVAYCGSMNGVTISEIEHEIEEKLNNLNLPKPEIKKIFFTCVELIQNQFLYSVSDEGITQNNYFIISKMVNLFFHLKLKQF